MAQAAILAYSLAKPEIARRHPTYYLGKVKAEFILPVLPGDKLILEATIIKIIDTAGIVDCIAMVDDKIVAKSNLVFGVKNNE
jgi:3-hydroxyacyl-[acyl-carrier-protein] dehydratase